MTLTQSELEFLSAWAREEWQPECYQAPAHRLQLAHSVNGALLIDFIKAWTKTEDKRDQQILDAADNSAPNWPWTSPAQFQSRRVEAIQVIAGRGLLERRD